MVWGNGHIDVIWIDGGREPQCEPDPYYPNGRDINASQGAMLSCKVDLLYPAPRCGMHHLKCRLCKLSVMITAAGRIDDPRTVIVACTMDEQTSKVYHVNN